MVAIPHMVLTAEYPCALKCLIELEIEHLYKTTIVLLREADNRHARIHAAKGDFKYSKIKHKYLGDTDDDCFVKKYSTKTDRHLCGRTRLEHDA